VMESLRFYRDCRSKRTLSGKSVTNVADIVVSAVSDCTYQWTESTRQTKKTYEFRMVRYQGPEALLRDIPVYVRNV
jgi:hypothetical protein